MGMPSLGGGEASPGLRADLQLVATLPQTARDDLWTLLEPHLGPVIPDAVPPAVAAYCRTHGVTEDELVPVIRGCRELFRTAAGQDVAVEQVAKDLEELLGGDRDVARVLVGCYSKALAGIRSLNVLALMAEYGAVLDDVGVRMDLVQASRHAPSSMVPIAIMSLRYRQDDEKKHLAIQVPVPVLAKLKALCDAMIDTRAS